MYAQPHGFPYLRTNRREGSVKVVQFGEEYSKRDFNSCWRQRVELGAPRLQIQEMGAEVKGTLRQSFSCFRFGHKCQHKITTVKHSNAGHDYRGINKVYIDLVLYFQQ